MGQREEIYIRGDVLARLREAMGWTQGELAYHARVDQSQISKIERGTLTDVRLSTAVRLARALNVTVDKLATGSELPEEPVEEGQLPNELTDTLVIIGRDRYISPETRRWIMDMIRRDYEHWRRERQGENTENKE